MTLTIGIKTKLIDPQPLKQALIASALDVENDAKRIITENKNVVTGRLRGSITYSLRDNQDQPVNPATGSDAVTKPNFDMVAKIGTNVEYAPHIEYGTIRAGQGGIWSFMRRAIIGQQKNIIERFKKALKQSVEG